MSSDCGLYSNQSNAYYYILVRLLGDYNIANAKYKLRG